MTSTSQTTATARLRPATAADAEAVCAIWHRGWSDGHLGHVPAELVRQRRPEDLRKLVPPRLPSTTVATVGPAVVGFVSLHGDEIEELYVDAAARGTGVADALLAHGERVIGTTAGNAWLAVAAGNARARRFYERNGWSDGGPFDYAAPHPDGGSIPVPVRRYEKRLAPDPGTPDNRAPDSGAGVGSPANGDAPIDSPPAGTSTPTGTTTAGTTPTDDPPAGTTPASSKAVAGAEGRVDDRPLAGTTPADDPPAGTSTPAGTTPTDDPPAGSTPASSKAVAGAEGRVDDRPLAGKVALVAGATRGAGRGIAVELGAAGATVYCTGRTTREARSEMNRPETIEETAGLVDAAGGRGIPVQVDHLDPDQVAALVDRIDREQGALHVLVNDIWGATTMEWNKTVWESTLDVGLRTLRLAVDTHAITAHFALPLLIRSPGGLVVEVTDGTAEYNATNYRVSFFYDLAKAANLRTAFALGHELAPHGATAVALTPGWLRSEAMLEAFGVREENWWDATERVPHFAIAESPAYVGRAVVALATDPDVARWNGQALSSGQLARVYGFTDVDGSQPDAWRYVPEVQDAGRPADTTGYR